MAQHALPHSRSQQALYEGFDYQAFWSEPARRHLDSLEHDVVSSLLPSSGRRILDAGCGFGRMTDVYVGRFDEVVLLDAAWSLLQQARDRWGDNERVTLVAADLRALPFASGAFDAAVAVRVLHHLEDPEPVLRQLRRSLAGGGRLVVSYSNKRNVKRVVRYALRRTGPNPFAPGIVPYSRRSFGWHPDDARRMFLSAGLRPGATRGVGVLDKVAGRAGAARALVPSGRALAPLFGRAELAPSLFVQAVAEGPADPGPAESPFACPACRDSLRAVGRGHACPSCRRLFPLREGILDFRL